MLQHHMLIDRDNYRMMKYKLLKRDNHHLLPVYETYFKIQAIRKKITMELIEGIDEKNLFIEKEWEYFDDEDSFTRKHRREAGRSDVWHEKRLTDEVFVTKCFLNSHQECIFVFGDNTVRKGIGGAAKLRNELNSYGFITKKYPSHSDNSYYRPDEYGSVFDNEVCLLLDKITKQKDKIFLISKLGAGLANKYNIYEKIIARNLYDRVFCYGQPNILFLYNVEDEMYKASRFLDDDCYDECEEEVYDEDEDLDL